MLMNVLTRVTIATVMLHAAIMRDILTVYAIPVFREMELIAEVSKCLTSITKIIC